MTALVSLPVAARVRSVAVVGNPNTGKSTVFNALTGFRQRVANYPGVTVERRTGYLKVKHRGESVAVIDLPGTYSLAVHAEDEAIVLDALLGRTEQPPDLIVSVVDASNLARNLFLTTQILELGTPVVVALNMIDIAENEGIRIDSQALAKELGVPVVPMVATRGIGVAELSEAILQGLDSECVHHCASFPECVCAELDGLCNSLASRGSLNRRAHRAEVMQSLLVPGGYHESELVKRCGRGLAEELAERRHRIRSAGESLVEIEAQVRYAWIDRVVQATVRYESPKASRYYEKVDRVLTHPVWGLAVFAFLMGACFQSIYAWAAPVMELVDLGFASLGEFLGTLLPEGALQSLVVNGVVAGVGSVLTFLPQILVLFFFIAILEDCGYMARAAFLMDRWMGMLGLNGKSFIPLLSSFACAVPGIMATRTIEHRRDRMLTILIAPLMSCSARLPVYVLLIGAFVPGVPLLGGVINLQAAVLLAMYCVGALTAIAVALVLKHTILKGAGQSFLMELPTYKWPSPKVVFFRVYEQGKTFTLSAGTLIFAVSIVIWALGYYPHPGDVAQRFQMARDAISTANFDDETRTTQLSYLNNAEASEYLRRSYLGQLGHLIEPAVRPLGWDWRIGTAAIASFPAREVVVATMGTIYGLGGEQDEHSEGLLASIKRATWPDGRPVFNLAVALSLMVFFALCCQCGATLAVIKRETRSWKWPVFTFVYMTALAYFGALAAYQITIRLI